MKKKKILHGLSEVAGQGWYSVLGLRHIGKEVELVTWMKNPFGYPEDLVLNIDKSKRFLRPFYMIKMLFFFFRAIIKYSTFHFHFGKSILYNHDLGILKKLHKKIVFEFHGSEIRDPSIKFAQTKNPYFSKGELNPSFKKNNEKICKYADGIIFHDDELISHLPEFNGNIFVVPLRMDLEKFDPVYPAPVQKKVTIVHAPSKRSIKGTEHVLEAVDKLKEKYDVELILVENTTQEEAKKIYQKADIIIDQIVIGTYGVFAIEGMALGKPVITYIDDFMKDRLPEELPIISADYNSLYLQIENLVQHPKLREKKGIAGRTYVENYHDYRNIGKMLSLIYENKLQSVQGRDAFEVVKKISEEND